MNKEYIEKLYCFVKIKLQLNNLAAFGMFLTFEVKKAEICMY